MTYNFDNCGTDGAVAEIEQFGRIVVTLRIVDVTGTRHAHTGDVEVLRIEENLVGRVKVNMGSTARQVEVEGEIFWIISGDRVQLGFCGPENLGGRVKGGRKATSSALR